MATNPGVMMSTLNKNPAVRIAIVPSDVAFSTSRTSAQNEDSAARPVEARPRRKSGARAERGPETDPH